MKGARGSVDWFSEHVPAWDKYVVPRLAGKRDATALIVGPYDGRCVKWLFENALLGPKSKATVVAAFGTYPPCVSYLGKGVWNPDVKAAFLKNTRAFTGRIALVDEAGGSLRRMAVARSRPSFDFIYVDTTGSRQALDTAVVAFPMLAPGGVMCFTNYVNNKEHDQRCPRRGIDAFVDCYASDVRVLRSAFHYFLERRVSPLPRTPCHSEFFEEPSRPVTCRKVSHTAVLI